MKRLLVYILTLILCISATSCHQGSTAILPPIGFEGTASRATFALFGHLAAPNVKGEMVDIDHFICTATAYAKVPGGYKLLSAGHCIQTDVPGLDYYVEEDLHGAKYPVSLVKSAFDGHYDFAVFFMPTTNHFPVIALGTEAGARVGGKTININFGYGLGKQLSRGTISSGLLANSEDCGNCVDRFMVQMNGAEGSSGSAVISATTHKIIGIAEGEFPHANVGMIIEPISNLAGFLALPPASPTK
jgi:hypothetical protein